MSQNHILDRAVRRSFTALCWNVGTPVAMRALRALENDDWVALTTVKVAVKDYRCPRTLSGDLQIASFFKKYPGFNLGIDKEKLAVESFWSSERQCYLANERLAPLTHDIDVMGEGVGSLLRAIRKEVAIVLGRCPLLDDVQIRFGPGSTFSDVGSLITIPDKMSENYTLTPNARLCLIAWDSTAWSRYAAAGLEIYRDRPLIGNDPVAPGFGQNSTDSMFAPRIEEFVRGNRFTTVPKDAWKLRGICIEPSVNLAFQLGIGGIISKRMNFKWGWRKSVQQQFHRLLARVGSLTKQLATIDLSNASDTVCYNLVKLLLPKDWFSLLCSVRSPMTCVKGKWVRLEKFSSMGNGFTFELETLLFRAIANIVARSSKNDGLMYSKEVSTFGDDIICPTDVATDVIATLEFLGFKINRDKTFISGEFRESCGGDYFRGLDMRPHFLKEEPNEPHQYIALANGLRRFGIRHILCGGPDVYRKPWLRILDQLPSKIRDCRGPEALGDLVVNDEECTWKFTVRSSIRYFRVWRPVAFGRTRWHHFRPGVVLASALYGCGDGVPKKTSSISSIGSLGPRGLSVMDTGGVLSRVNGEYVSGYRFGRVAFS